MQPPAEADADTRAFFLNWLETFAGYVREVDYASARPEECILIEDSIVNIIPAAELGMTTVLIREGSPKHGAHHHISRITELESLLASLE